eukprot:NODE_186_length_13589_cov_0.385545.p12 type:complete len:176 gc:universal NODE_186_length_13589_cov_0.385545:4656-5183(+)
MGGASVELDSVEKRYVLIQETTEYTKVCHIFASLVFQDIMNIYGSIRTIDRDRDIYGLINGEIGSVKLSGLGNVAQLTIGDNSIYLFQGVEFVEGQYANLVAKNVIYAVTKVDEYYKLPNIGNQVYNIENWKFGGSQKLLRKAAERIYPIKYEMNVPDDFKNSDYPLLAWVEFYQ